VRKSASATAAYHRDWYAKNREKRIAQIRAYKKKVWDAVRAKKCVPCADCGVQYSYWIMQFDHVQDKSFGIGSTSTRRYGLTKILEEIEKCEVVCANCHADRTYKRQCVDTLV
jgi:hypothetical protein